MLGQQKCLSVSSLLWDYSAKRLPADENTRVVSHLQTCARCRAQAEEYQQTIALVAEYRQQSVPSSQSSWQSLRSQIESPQRSQPARWTLRVNSLAWAGATFAALLLLVATRDNWHQMEPQTPVAILMPSPGGDTSPLAEPHRNTGATPTEDPGNPDWDGHDLYPEVAAGQSLAAPPNTSRPMVQHTSFRTASARSRTNISHITRANTPTTTHHSSMGAEEEGGSLAIQPSRDYVLPPASSEDEDPRHYVIDTISTTPRNGTEDSRTW